MFDPALVREKLEQIMEAVKRIERRFAGITTPLDFLSTDADHDKLDAIAMLLIAIGESFKKIDKETRGGLLKKYPEIDWKGVMGVRDVLAHNYFDIDIEEIHRICSRDIPHLKTTLERMLEGLS